VPVFGGADRLSPDNDHFNYFLSQCRIRVEMALCMMTRRFGFLTRPLRIHPRLAGQHSFKFLLLSRVIVCPPLLISLQQLRLRSSTHRWLEWIFVVVGRRHCFWCLRTETSFCGLTMRQLTVESLLRSHPCQSLACMIVLMRIPGIRGLTKSTAQFCPNTSSSCIVLRIDVSLLSYHTVFSASAP
jgi:hypothetical protein